jgi:hypothetical protein
MLNISFADLSLEFKIESTVSPYVIYFIQDRQKHQLKVKKNKQTNKKKGEEFDVI